MKADTKPDTFSLSPLHQNQEGASSQLPINTGSSVFHVWSFFKDSLQIFNLDPESLWEPVSLNQESSIWSINSIFLLSDNTLEDCVIVSSVHSSRVN